MPAAEWINKVDIPDEAAQSVFIRGDGLLFVAEDSADEQDVQRVRTRARMISKQQVTEYLVDKGDLLKIRDGSHPDWPEVAPVAESESQDDPPDATPDNNENEDEAPLSFMEAMEASQSQPGDEAAMDTEAEPSTEEVTAPAETVSLATAPPAANKEAEPSESAVEPATSKPLKAAATGRQEGNITRLMSRERPSKKATPARPQETLSKRAPSTRVRNATFTPNETLKTYLREISPPKEVADYIFVDADNGRVLIAEAQRSVPQARSLDARVTMKGGRVEYVPIETVNRQREQAVETVSASISDSDTKKFAKRLFSEAVELGASDIHVRKYEKVTRVFMRVDGELIERPNYALNGPAGGKLLSTIYTAMGDGGMKETSYVERAGQDARISKRENLVDGLAGIRIASHPHQYGSYMVLRCLYQRGAAIDGTLDDRLLNLGYGQDHVDSIATMVARMKGLVTIGGETGSGKSTTLMHLLETIHSMYPGKNLMTVEDPPEYQIRGALQLPVVAADNQADRGEAFIRTMKMILRSDPDIIMMGEVRDPAGASMALQAAMTGHGTYTTLHTNSWVDNLVRLYTLIAGSKEGGALDPGVYFSNPDTLAGLLHQTLVGTLCPQCKQPLEGEAMKSFDQRCLDRLRDRGVLGRFKLFIKGDGCDYCRHTGIRGRSVVAEAVATNRDLLHIFQSATATRVTDTLKYWEEELNGRPEQAHALEKVAAGIVDPRVAEEKVGAFTEKLPMHMWEPRAETLAMAERLAS